MSISMAIAGFLTLICAAGVVLSRRSLHSALWLVSTLFLVAVHFALLGADFVAALQVLVYAGAIMVLVVFVIMLLGLESAAEKHNASISSSLAMVFVFSALMAGVVFWGSDKIFAVKEVLGKAPVLNAGDAKIVGKLLYTEYVYPLQITGLLLFAAIVGAVVLSHEKKRALSPGRGLRAVQDKSHG